VIDLARLIVAFAPQSLHADAGLGDRFVDALLRASDWDERWTPPMTKTKERNILLLLRSTANALQENAKFENISWALKVLIPFFAYLEHDAYLE
jgi:phospholipase A-2-activating protein